MGWRSFRKEAFPLKKPLYEIVSRDKWEHPLFLADNLAELSEMSGKSLKTLQRGFNRARERKFETGIYKEVWVDLDTFE